TNTTVGEAWASPAHRLTGTKTRRARRRFLPVTIARGGVYGEAPENVRTTAGAGATAAATTARPAGAGPSSASWRSRTAAKAASSSAETGSAGGDCIRSGFTNTPSLIIR